MKKIIIEIYKDKKNEFRWRMKRSGRIIADCSEGYKRRTSLVRTLNGIVAALAVGQFQIRETWLKVSTK